jgi:membrane-associated phospholipid phosphatase
VRAIEIVLLTLLLNTVVKQAVRRARPVLEEELPALTPVLSGRSYPSAHASTSFAGARALAAAGLPGPPLRIVAVAMALSRPYLGVHYPSDVVAGALLGNSVARLMTP